MEIVGSLILFILFMFVYMMIVEVFVMLFRITGLSDEKARFQVISMLTNSGYTTKEAELITNNKKRRKLARFVMFFGYAFTVTIVSTVVNIFIQFRKTYIGGAIAFIPIIIAVILLAWFFKKSKWTNTVIDKIIKKIAGRLVYDKNTNPIIIIDDYGKMIMARVQLLFIPEELKDKELSESNIKRDYGLNIVLKNNKHGDFLPASDTKFEVGDNVVVIGSEKAIRKVFEISADNVNK